MRAEVSLSKEEDKHRWGGALADNEQHKDRRSDPAGPGEGDHRAVTGRVQTVGRDKAEQDPVPGLLTAEGPVLKVNDSELQPGPSAHIRGWGSQAKKRPKWGTDQDYAKWDRKHREGSRPELTHPCLHSHRQLLARKLTGNRSITRLQLWRCRQIA